MLIETAADAMQCRAHTHTHTVRRAYSRDLFDCIDLHRRLSEATARKIFSQLLSAVAYLQSQVRSVYLKRGWLGGWRRSRHGGGGGVEGRVGGWVEAWMAGWVGQMREKYTGLTLYTSL